MDVNSVTPEFFSIEILHLSYHVDDSSFKTKRKQMINVTIFP